MLVPITLTILLLKNELTNVLLLAVSFRPDPEMFRHSSNDLLNMGIPTPQDFHWTENALFLRIHPLDQLAQMGL